MSINTQETSSVTTFSQDNFKDGKLNLFCKFYVRTWYLFDIILFFICRWFIYIKIETKALDNLGQESSILMQ